MGVPEAVHPDVLNAGGIGAAAELDVLSRPVTCAVLSISGLQATHTDICE